MQNALGVQYKVMKFRDNLKIFQQARDCNLITKTIGRLIFDKSFSTVKNCYQKMTKNQIKKLLSYQRNSMFQRCVEVIPLIEPTSRKKICWDILHLFLILMCLFCFPIDIVMKQDFQELYGDTWKSMIAFYIGFQLCDIFIIFNTGIFEQGTVIRDRKQIAEKYYKGNLIFDIVTLTPFIVQLFEISGNIKWWNLIILFKFAQFHQMIKDFKTMIYSQQKSYLLLSLAQLLFKIISINHCIGCIFLWFGIYSQMEGDDENWLTKNNLSEVHWLEQYTYSLYFSVTTMTTVGYGDLVAKNVFEVIFVIVSMLLSTGMFAYIFNCINSLIEELEYDTKQFKSHRKLVNKYLNSKNINQNLKMQVLKFLEYNFKTDKEVSEKEELFVLGNLSYKLRNQIQFEANTNLIQKCHTVLGMYSYRTRLKLTKLLKQRRIKKNDSIYNSHVYDPDPMLYIIESGEVEVFTDTRTRSEHENTILQTLKEGQFFGENEFYSGYSHITGTKAKTNCVLYSISRRLFIDIIKRRKDDFEQFCLLRDSVQQGNYIKLNTQCSGCKKFYHLTALCPYTHLKVDKEFLILKNQYGSGQEERRSIKIIDDFEQYHQAKFHLHKNKEKSRLLCNLSDIQHNAEAIQDDMEYSQVNQEYKEDKHMEFAKSLFAGGDKQKTLQQTMQEQMETQGQQKQFFKKSFQMDQNGSQYVTTSNSSDDLSESSRTSENNYQKNGLLDIITKIVQKEINQKSNQIPSSNIQNTFLQQKNTTETFGQSSMNKDQINSQIIQQQRKSSGMANFNRRHNILGSYQRVSDFNENNIQNSVINSSGSGNNPNFLLTRQTTEERRNSRQFSSKFMQMLQQTDQLKIIEPVNTGNSNNNSPKLMIHRNSVRSSKNLQVNNHSKFLSGQKQPHTSDKFPNNVQYNQNGKETIWSKVINKSKQKKEENLQKNLEKQKLQLEKEQLIHKGKFDKSHVTEFHKLDKPAIYDFYYPLFNYNQDNLRQRLQFLIWFEGSPGFGVYTLSNRRRQRKTKNQYVSIKTGQNDQTLNEKGKDILLRFQQSSY